MVVTAGAFLSQKSTPLAWKDEFCAQCLFKSAPLGYDMSEQRQ